MEHTCRPSAAAVAIGYRSLLNRSVYEGASPLSSLLCHRLSRHEKMGHTSLKIRFEGQVFTGCLLMCF